MKRTLILASGSPRRIAMMKEHGITPLVRPAAITENIPLYHGMTETVMFLALKKAKAAEAAWLAEVAETAGGLGAGEDGQQRPAALATDKPPIIIAADTIVYKDEIMGKPRDKAEGMRMLQDLRNTDHDVVTGVALVEAGGQNARVFYERTKVWFGDYTDEELSNYLDTDEAYDKAGGYAIQGYFIRFIDHIDGDYHNVVGFPWKRIAAELAVLAPEASII